MQHHLTRLGSAAVPGGRCRLVCRVRSVAGRGRAGCGRAGRRRWSGVRRGSRWIPAPAARAHPCATAASRSRASARSSSPVSWLVPPKETCWWSMVKCRASAAFSASSAAWSGMNRAIASAISRSSAARPMRCANGATWASTNAAASWDNMNVASAIRRARHASRSPDCIRAQQRGSRYFSSTAAATSARPASVERPIARANSAMQNSATNGAPSPASVRPVSPPGVIQVAASSIDSGGCCSAQVTAATIRSACARLAAAWLSRANTSTSREESRLLAVGVGGRCHG